MIGFARRAALCFVGSSFTVWEAYAASGGGAHGFLANDIALLDKDLFQAMAETVGSGAVMDPLLLSQVRTVLEPMWESLAKRRQDRVDLRVMQYVVNRFFVQQHGMSIGGFDTSRWNSSHGDSSLLMTHASTFVMNMLQGTSAEKGFSINDATGMVLMLQQFVKNTLGHHLEDIYGVEGFQSQTSVDAEELFRIMERQLGELILGSSESVDDMRRYPPKIREMIDQGDEMLDFLRGRIKAFDHRGRTGLDNRSESRTWTPFNRRYSFEDAVTISSDAFLSLGEYWASECSAIKAALQKFDTRNSGRLSINDFHNAALNGEWRFGESKEYLRELGALDESAAFRTPQVIITNYLHSPSNCIASTAHARVCCRNECEFYLSEIESAVKASAAMPETILGVVEHFTAGLDDDKVTVSRTLKNQLFNIAASNGGTVPLHGRLFAQWLHYMFPMECPYPHVTGTIRALSPLEFGKGSVAQKSEMYRHRRELTDSVTNANGTHWTEVHEWNHEEELLSSSVQLVAPWESSSSVTTLFKVAAMVAVGLGIRIGSSGASSNFRMASAFRSKSSKVEFV